MKEKRKRFRRFAEDTGYNYLSMIIILLGADVLIKIPQVGLPALGIAVAITAVKEI